MQQPQAESGIARRTAVHLLMAGLFVAVCLFKMPQVYVGGRLWAEEGTIFLPDMFHRSFTGAVFYQFRGNVQLINSIVIWIASRTPSTIMPYVTTYAGVLISLLVFVQLRQLAVQTRMSHAVFAIFLIAWLLLPSSYEVWANSINIQWLCCLSVLMVLLNDDKASRHSVLCLTWVGICGLTGVPSCMLAPAFLLRAWLARSQADAEAGVILLLCSVVQIATIVLNGIPERHLAVLPGSMLRAAAFQTIIAPILGIQLSGWILPLRHIGSLIAGIATLLIPALIVLPLRMACRFPIAVVAWVWPVVTCINMIGSLEGAEGLASEPLAGSRYFFFGASCFCLCLAGLTTASSKAVSMTATGLLLLVAGSGVAQRLVAQWPDKFVAGPLWQRQLAACAPNTPCAIQIWPGPGNKWWIMLPSARQG